MYAIIEDSGTQIWVREGDTIKVDLRDLPEEEIAIRFDRVLALNATEAQGEAISGETTLGRPYIEGASVEGDILSEERSEKVDVVKFKRRKGYRRRKGHRQGFLKVRITAINAA